MKSTKLRALGWVIKLQFSASPFGVLFTLFYSIILGLRGVLVSYLVAQFLAAVGLFAVNRQNPERIYWLLAAITAIEITMQILGSIDRLVQRQKEQRSEILFNEWIINKIYTLSQSQFDDQTLNTKLDRATDSLFAMRRSVDSLGMTLSDIASFFSAVGAVMVISWPVGLGLVVASIPAAILQLRQAKMYDAAYRQTEPIERIAYSTRFSLINTHMMSEVRILNAFKQLLEHWRKTTQKSQNVFNELERKIIVQNVLLDLVQPLTIFLASVYFIGKFIAGKLALDHLIFVRGVLDQAGSAVVSVVRTVQSTAELALSINNFHEFISIEPSIPNGSVEVVAPLTIECMNVSFKYPNTKRYALRNVSLRIEPGSQIALVGENGAGKSTLLKLLLRQYLPTTGKILVNGVDIADVEQASYYRSIGVLSQGYLLLRHLTIRDNLELGLQTNLTDRQVLDATKLTGANTFIERLPHKLQERMDPSYKDGSGFSGGQVQRLGISRALLRNGDILILDEPTSAIDAKAEFSIFNNIYKSHAGKTTIIVSHRFSTVRKAQIIMVMDGGRVTESGSHEELLERGGLYKEMFEIQAEGYR